MKHPYKNETEFDRALGIDASLTDIDWSVRRRHPCQPTPLVALYAVAERLGVGEVIVDCGCGTGRAVFFFAAMGFYCTGVELDERRFVQAMDNLARCRKRAPETAERVTLANLPAQNFAPDEHVTALYFFNPFPAAVLRGVLRRIGERRVRLFCYYPDDEWVDLLLEESWRLEESIDLRDALGKDARERVDVFGR